MGRYKIFGYFNCDVEFEIVADSLEEAIDKVRYDYHPVDYINKTIGVESNDDDEVVDITASFYEINVNEDDCEILEKGENDEDDDEDE